jgi:hypothetical protein
MPGKPGARGWCQRERERRGQREGWLIGRGFAKLPSFMVPLADCGASQAVGSFLAQAQVRDRLR